jgi:hypothetical protein
MTFDNQQPRFRDKHVVLLTIGILAFMALVSTRHHHDTSTSSSTATSTAVTAASASASAPATSTGDAYIALLAKWSKRDGWPMGDTDQLIAAGHKVCALMKAGEGNIVASHDVMQQFNFSGQVAQAVGVAAWDTFCPDAER